MDRPVIGICTAWERARWSVWDDEAALLPRSYIEAVQRAGGLVAMLPPDPGLTERPADALDLIDGLMLVGGADIDPGVYDADRHAETVDTVPDRDRFEIALVRGALERDLPVLGICRGIQLLNVACGGTLVQHLEDVIDQTPHRLDDANWGAHEVVTVEGSRLRSIVGERPHVRSHHHQGIGDVGEGLSVTAHAHDGTIEGLERAGSRFCIGVLWHPEADVPGSGRPLFDALVSSAR